GLLLGGLLLALPQMYGVGYPVLENAIEGKYAVGLLVLLLVGKVVATSLTIGIGGSGGVFAPSLFLGAMTGTAFGATAHQLLPGTAGAVGAYGLVGMGAAFAGSARAPITAVIVLFELTGEYSIILPMMLAIVLATLTSRLLSRDTIYTLKLRRRGIDLDSARLGSPLAGASVREVMEELPTALSGDLPLEDATDVIARSGHGVLPVTDQKGRYAGVVTARAVAEALTEPDPALDAQATPRTIADLAEQPPAVTAGAPLSGALHTLVTADGAGLPVLDADTGEPVGWLTHQTVLSALHAPAHPAGSPR
ncbi:chloride channel protein, partial [Streptomyces sp. BRA346]|uniref:chloride channel protein n=1 Tax=Streptomyces sp. BRA346 TaxID=2878199 RepID=UPI004062E797